MTSIKMNRWWEDELEIMHKDYKIALKLWRTDTNEDRTTSENEYKKLRKLYKDRARQNKELAQENELQTEILRRTREKDSDCGY